MNNSNLIKQIKEAFATVRYPGDSNIVLDSARGDGYEFLNDIKGKDWRDIDEKLYERWQSITVQLSPEGFQYYIPGFILASLSEDQSLEIDWYVAYAFKPDTGLENDEPFYKRVSLLDSSQRSAICNFLKTYFKENPFEEGKDTTLRFWCNS